MSGLYYNPRYLPQITEASPLIAGTGEGSSTPLPAGAPTPTSDEASHEIQATLDAAPDIITYALIRPTPSARAPTPTLNEAYPTSPARVPTPTSDESSDESQATLDAVPESITDTNIRPTLSDEHGDTATAAREDYCTRTLEEDVARILEGDVTRISEQDVGLGSQLGTPIPTSDTLLDECGEHLAQDIINMETAENILDCWSRNPRQIMSLIRWVDVNSNSGETAIDVKNSTYKIELHDQHTIYIRSDGSDYVYPFDFVMGSSFDNSAVNLFIKPLIELVVKGEDVSIVTDGYSGSGKSYTMFSEDDSLARYAANLLHEGLGGGQITFAAAQIRDKTQVEHFDFDPRQLREFGITAGGNSVITDGCHYQTSIAESLVNVIDWLDKHRATEPTTFNERSSRSHLALGLKPRSSRGRLMMVDLAGAESSDATQNVKGTLGINISRTSLRNAMLHYSSWSPKKKNFYVNWRDSKVRSRARQLTQC